MEARRGAIKVPTAATKRPIQDAKVNIDLSAIAARDNTVQIKQAMRRVQDLLVEQIQRRSEALKLWEPLPIQDQFHQSGCRVRLVRAGNRAGKAQPVDEPVLTPFGWRPIGLLEEGDLVIGGDGRPARVTGIFHQGVRPVYAITTNDGSRTRSCGEHLWKVAIGNRRFRREEPDWEVAELNDIIRRCGTRPAPKMKPLLPSCSVTMPERPVPIDPYMMGVLLGDGCLASNVVSFTTADDGIVDSLRSMVPNGINVRKKSRYDYSIAKASSGGRNPVLDVMRWYGLLGKKSYEKHVPSDYLFNSERVRLAVLQGLMDTDGSPTRRSKADFSTTSPQLADDVAYLVRSLGGTAATQWRQTGYVHKGHRRKGRPSARMYVRMPEGKCPFRLARKTEVYNDGYANNPGRYIESIEPAGECECVCISVDSPDRTYLTSDCIVTHNTLVAAVEVARAATNSDPHKKYPEKGDIYVIAEQWGEIGRVIYPKLFQKGPFKVIKDKATGYLRAYRPWMEEDRARASQAREAEPLIPKRYIAKVAWHEKKLNQPALVELTTGWKIHFFSGDAKPASGSAIDIAWLDEEIKEAEWFVELNSRIADREGRIIWTATPEVGTDQFHDYCQKAQDHTYLLPHEREAEEYKLSLAENPHLSEKSKAGMASMLSDQDYQIRILGEFASVGRVIFPEYKRPLHGIEYFEIPKGWTHYASIDPGHQICAVLFAAVPDPMDMLEREDPFDLIVFDELYIPKCNAKIFAEQFERKVRDYDLEDMVIDMHGSRVTEAGSGLSIYDQYATALTERGVTCNRRKHGFALVDDDVKSSIERCRYYLGLRPAFEDRPGPATTPRLRIMCKRDERGQLHPLLPNFDWEIARWKYKVVKDHATEEPETRGRVHSMACLRYLCGLNPRFVPQKNRRKNELVSWIEREQRAYARQQTGVNRPGIVFGPAGSY